MPVSSEKKRVIDAIVSLNETGKLPSPSAYSTATVLKDGAGISYGIHQSTDRSNSLDAIVFRYLDLGGIHSAELRPFLDELERNDSTKVDPKSLPQWVKDLLALLAKAGLDPLMQRAQDEIFAENYWAPAESKCAGMGLVTPLAHLVIYDTVIQSGPSRVDSLRKNFPQVPPARGGDEKAWVTAFLAARRAFLLSSSNPLVQRSVYRVDSMLGLTSAGNWDLVTPLVYRGATVP